MLIINVTDCPLKSQRNLETNSQKPRLLWVCDKKQQLGLTRNQVGVVKKEAGKSGECGVAPWCH